MTPRLSRLITPALAALAMASPFIPVSGQMPARAPRYAITNAKIFPIARPATAPSAAPKPRTASLATAVVSLVVVIVVVVFLVTMRR